MHDENDLIAATTRVLRPQGNDRQTAFQRLYAVTSEVPEGHLEGERRFGLGGVMRLAKGARAIFEFSTLLARRHAGRQQ